MPRHVRFLFNEGVLEAASKHANGHRGVGATLRWSIYCQGEFVKWFRSTQGLKYFSHIFADVAEGRKTTKVKAQGNGSEKVDENGFDLLKRVTRLLREE